MRHALRIITIDADKSYRTLRRRSDLESERGVGVAAPTSGRNRVHTYGGGRDDDPDDIGSLIVGLHAGKS